MSNIREHRRRDFRDELPDRWRPQASPGKVSLTSRIQGPSPAARAAEPRDEASVQRKVLSEAEAEAGRAEMARWETAALLGFDPEASMQATGDLGGQDSDKMHEAAAHSVDRSGQRAGTDVAFSESTDLNMVACGGGGVARPIQAAGLQEGIPEAPVRLTGHGAGAEMPEDVRRKMEAAFGVDFSRVRIHEGPHAESLGALAYTQGTDIHFAPGQYQPRSQRGQELLGHELTHVVQQSQGRVRTTQAQGVDINDDASLEREADEMGARAARGEEGGESSHGLIGVPALGSVVQQASRNASASSGIARQVAQRKRDDMCYPEEPVCQAEPAPPPPLSEKEKENLIGLTRTRLSFAYTDLSIACQNLKIALKAAAQAKAEMIEMFIEVGMGFLVPGLARGLSKLVNNIPVGSPNFVYALTLQLQNSKTAEALLTGATNVGTVWMKKESMKLFGETETDRFLRDLKRQYKKAFDLISEELTNRSDYEIAATWAAFDPTQTDEESYIVEFKRLTDTFHGQVESQHGMRSLARIYSSDVLSWHSRLAYYIEGFGSRPAIVVEESTIGPFYSRDVYTFIAWVDSKFEDMAIERTIAIEGKMKTLPRSKIRNWLALY